MLQHRVPYGVFLQNFIKQLFHSETGEGRGTITLQKLNENIKFYAKLQRKRYESRHHRKTVKFKDKLFKHFDGKSA